MTSNETIDLDFILECQDLLINLSNDTLPEVKLFFKDSEFFNDEGFIHELLEMILLFSDIRPKLISTYCDLLNFVNTDIIPIKSTLLNLFFCASNCDEAIYLNINRFYFLREMMNFGLFTSSEIVDKIYEYSQNHSPENFYSSSIFCYFIPEIKEYNMELYNSMLNTLAEEMKKISAPGCIFDVYNNFEKLSENNFEIYKRLFEDMKNNPLILDSENEFSKGLTDVNQRKRSTIFGIPPFLQNMPTLIQCAAFFGSIKCFKYLLLNDADLTMLDGLSRSLVHFAIAGGNLEIIWIISHLKLSFDGSLQIAARFHRKDIFHWLMENKFSIDFLINTGSIFCQAAMRANLYVMLFCIENGIDVNIRDEHGWTALHYAARDNVISSLNLLLRQDNIDANISNGNTTPLHIAVTNGRFDAVKCLINSCKVDINRQVTDGISS